MTAKTTTTAPAAPASSPARDNAVKALREALTGLDATAHEVVTAFDRWESLTGGKRPGYFAAQTKVLANLTADREAGTEAPANTAPVAPSPTAPAKGKGKAAAAPAAPAKGKGKGKAAEVPAPAKAAKAPAEPKVPARKVESVKATPGAYLKQRRLVRRTRTEVTIWDLTHADSTFGVLLTADGVEGKYVVVCEDHSAKVAVTSYEKAWKAALDPAQHVCSTCRKAAEKATAA